MSVFVCIRDFVFAIDVLGMKIETFSKRIFSMEFLKIMEENVVLTNIY